MTYFNDMSTQELRYCIRYLDYKAKHGMTKQAEEDARQRSEITRILNERKVHK